MPPATDLAGSFRRLHERGVLSEATSTAMGKASGLRNIVAHVYAQADPELLFAAASSGLDDLDQFSGEIARWIQHRLEG